jgi:uncharacterized RDD family membrane protein YckC
MNVSAHRLDESSTRSAPAPLLRRIGAHLLDSALTLLAAYLATAAIQPAYNLGFGDVYLALCQSFIIGWVVLKDSWWPGQSLGKRVSRIRIIDPKSGTSATRFHCVWRMTIFILVAAAIYLPAYLSISRSPDFVKQAVFSAVLSAGAPIRLPPLLPALKSLGPIAIAHLILLGFVVLELALVYRRRDRRRIVDLLAGTQVIDDRSPHCS